MAQSKTGTKWKRSTDTSSSKSWKSTFENTPCFWRSRHWIQFRTGSKLLSFSLKTLEYPRFFSNRLLYSVSTQGAWWLELSLMSVMGSAVQALFMKDTQSATPPRGLISAVEMLQSTSARCWDVLATVSRRQLKWRLWDRSKKSIVSSILTTWRLTQRSSGETLLLIEITRLSFNCQMDRSLCSAKKSLKLLKSYSGQS